MRISRIALALTALSALALGTTLSLGVRAQEADTSTPPPTPACNEQQPIDYLVRGNWVVKARMPREEQQRRRELHQQAIRFRTEHYGHFEGFGRAEWNPHPPLHYARPVSFMGLRVRLNERIHPAIQCAEQAIREQCSAHPYQPQRLSGIRDRNTYHNGEVSNHVYGIALDIDPQRNTCCGCVAPWRDHPLCQREVESIYERMVMPECWVQQFERFGFYWLGHDELQDTMHFEFLGDPDRILAGSTAGSAGSTGGATTTPE